MAKPSKDAMSEALQMLFLLTNTNLGNATAGDLGAVRAQVEKEVTALVHSAAGDLKRPTLKDLVDHMFDKGPLYLGSIEEHFKGQGLIPDGIAPALNRLHGANLVFLSPSESHFQIVWERGRADWDAAAARRGFDLAEKLGLVPWFK